MSQGSRLKKTLYSFMFTVLLISILYSAFNHQSVKAASTITVPDDYTTIQEAVDAASDGDTIFVRAGTYYEHVTIGKNNLTLVGENGESIVDGNGTGTIFSVSEPRYLSLAWPTGPRQLAAQGRGIRRGTWRWYAR